jgi:hypothetical protein
MLRSIVSGNSGLCSITGSSTRAVPTTPDGVTTRVAVLPPPSICVRDAAAYRRLVQFRDNALVGGLSFREAVALAARPRSPSQQNRLGYSGSWTNDPSKLTNDYFKVRQRGARRGAGDGRA